MSQMSAVTGRRYRTPYVDIINAQTPYLPQIRQAEADAEYRDKVLAQNQQQLDLARDQAEWQAGQEKTANIIGLGKLGLDTYFGLKRNSMLDSAINAPTALPEGALGAGAMSPASATAEGGGFLSGLKTAGGRVTETASRWAPAGIGGLTGYAFGDDVGQFVPFGGEKEKATVGGAAVGALSGAIMSGGDPTTMLVSGLVGGIGGWLGG